jgi:hypothetical protein
MTKTIAPAMERGLYPTFHQQFVSWRPANIGSKLVDLDQLQLPANSVLHVVDQLLATHVDSVLPDLTTPFIRNETYQLMLEVIQAIPGADAQFPITDHYRFRPNSFTQEIRDFWSKQHQIKRASSRSALLSRSMTLPILDYNEILMAQITGGQFIYYRHFDLVFRTILNTITSIAGKHQWLQIPLSRTIYRKQQFVQTFDAITYQTVKVKDDPSFYFLLHLVNFVAKGATSSLFSQLSQDVLDTFNVVLVAGTKTVIYNLGDLKAIVDARTDNNFYQLVLRHINTLKLAGYVGHDVTDLSEHDYDKVIDAAASKDDHPPEDAVLPEVTPPATPVGKTMPHSVAKITDKPGIVTPVNPTKAVLPSSAPTIKSTEPSPIMSTPVTAATPIQPVEPAAPKQVLPLPPDSLLNSVDAGAYHSIMTASHLTDDQRAAALKASLAYKKLLVDGVSIEEHLQQTAEPPISDNRLDFLKGKLPDESMLSSTAINLDRHYLDHVMAKDIAAVATSLNQNGMFLVAMEQRDEITQLNRIRHYKATYQDLAGRRHTVLFKLPVVSSNGTIMINGIESRMIKQQVNLPICKIDSDRVSLASSYNKTLVERIHAKAHNFNAYITRYIGQIYKAKVGLTLSYGELTSTAKLPYDYTSLAKRYSTLQFDGKLAGWDVPASYRFTFDYDRRFATVAVEASERSYPESTEEHRLDTLSAYEKTYGVYCGTATAAGIELLMFFGSDNKIQYVFNQTSDRLRMRLNPFTFTEVLFQAFGDLVTPPKTLSEWTELKILDKSFPIVFILGFEYGLDRVLDHINLDYQFIPSGTRFPRTPTTIVVPFADGNLVFDRYPLDKSFIAAGLLKFATRAYEKAQFNSPDIYYALLQDAEISLNYLKGISDFFRLFIDPITRDVLLRMHEPTDVGRLLVRATQMLTTEDAIPSASMRNHRLRGYERFATTLYNEMARAYASYSRQRGNRKPYSINPEAVFLRLIQDQTLHITEDINPIENIKDQHAATYTGSGGRTAQSFVIEDRQFPADGIGVLSEATPYNSKVAISTYVSASPLVANVRGMFDLDNVDIEKLEPSQILSVPTLLMPCTTNDDGKRVAFVSIQLKHHVPSEHSETMRVRTGYEAVVAHRTGETFACTAKRDGIVEAIDPKLGMIRVCYTPVVNPPLPLEYVAKTQLIRAKFSELATRELLQHHPIYIAQEDGATTGFHLHDTFTFNDTLVQVADILPLTDVETMPMGSYLTPEAKDALRHTKHAVLIKLLPSPHNAADEVDVFKFGTKFTSVAGSFVKQTIVCNVEVGEHIHRGDVLAYNSGFFELDPFDAKQVTWKHGIMANVVLMEGNDTVEDSNAITAEFSRKLETANSHLRTLQVKAKTIIRDILEVGTEVQTTDLLCTLDDADIDALSDSEDNEMLELLTSLNRKAPRARYHGTIAEIDMLYSCPLSEMHPSLAKLAQQINARKARLATAAAGTHKVADFPPPSQVTVGMKYHGVEFEADTILIMFYITEMIDQGAGDKIVLCGQAKSVTASVIEQPISTQNGTRVDLLFSARSVNNRIITSPTTVGFSNRVMEQLEKKTLELYFAD